MLSAVPMPTSVTDWKLASGVERMIKVVVAYRVPVILGSPGATGPAA